MITITDSAARHFAAMIARSNGMTLRLSVRKTGCSGYAYSLELIDAPYDDLVSHESNGIVVWIPQNDLPMLAGIQLDYVRDGMFENLKFINPNVKSECGCGESFRT